MTRPRVSGGLIVSAVLNVRDGETVFLLAAGVFGGRDLFEVWRLLLGTACTIYALVLTVRSLGGWCAYLSGADRGKSMMRNYAMVLLLRLRLRSFAWELARIGFWSLALLAVLYGHDLWGLD